MNNFRPNARVHFHGQHRHGNDHECAGGCVDANEGGGVRVHGPRFHANAHDRDDVNGDDDVGACVPVFLP